MNTSFSSYSRYQDNRENRLCVICYKNKTPGIKQWLCYSCYKEYAKSSLHNWPPWLKELVKMSQKEERSNMKENSHSINDSDLLYEERESV